MRLKSLKQLHSAMNRSIYSDWTREQLIDQLLAYDSAKAVATINNNNNNNNNNTTTTTATTARSPPCKRLKGSSVAPIGHSNRKVAFKVAYLGFDYHGFARQELEKHTIEHYLLQALERSQLLPIVTDDPCPSNDVARQCQLSRCGRTDKGVSAFGQVIGCLVRSNLFPAATAVSDPQPGPRKEFGYKAMLNAHLPSDIRILDWAPAPSDFDARFDCTSRSYRYHFFKADLDIDQMHRAAQYFIGTHDFSNFCKQDHSKENVNYERTILEAHIQPFDTVKSELNQYQLYTLSVKGHAFLYHQIRLMMSILYLVGKGIEKPEIVLDLFNLQKYPKKPSYELASEIPLVLWDCTYRNIAFTNEPDAKTLAHFYQMVQDKLSRGIVTLTMLQGLLLSDEQKPSSSSSLSETRKDWMHPGIHLKKISK